MATKGELTVRQETFCRKFLEIGEATEAYRQSGYKHENYSDKSLWERASHLLADAKVAARIRETEVRGLSEPIGLYSLASSSEEA